MKIPSHASHLTIVYYTDNVTSNERLSMGYGEDSDPAMVGVTTLEHVNSSVFLGPTKPASKFRSTSTPPPTVAREPTPLN